MIPEVTFVTFRLKFTLQGVVDVPKKKEGRMESAPPNKLRFIVYRVGSSREPTQVHRGCYYGERGLLQMQFSG